MTRTVPLKKSRHRMTGGKGGEGHKGIQLFFKRNFRRGEDWLIKIGAHFMHRGGKGKAGRVI